MSSEIGLKGSFFTYGSIPQWDYCGYEVSIDVVLASKNWRHSKSYSPFDTVRENRIAVGNFHRIFDSQARCNLSLESMVGSSKEIISSNTSSLQFRSFFSGLRSRMGEVTKLKLALPANLIIKSLNHVLIDMKLAN